MSPGKRNGDTQNSLNTRAEKMTKHRNKIKATAAKERRDAAKIIMRPWKNLKKYRKMSMDKKFDFALSGYFLQIIRECQRSSFAQRP
jgi:hypothetical protein